MRRRYNFREASIRYANTTAAAVNVTYDVYATKNDNANNQQLIKKQSDNFLVPKRDQSFTPDADGNTLSTGVWNYTWNAAKSGSNFSFCVFDA